MLFAVPEIFALDIANIFFAANHFSLQKINEFGSNSDFPNKNKTDDFGVNRDFSHINKTNGLRVNRDFSNKSKTFCSLSI